MAFVLPANEAATAFEDPERLYGLIAETIPVMVWTANAAGGVDFVNQRVVEYTGLDSAALTSWAWKTIVHPDDLERCVATWTRALQTGERCENEMRLRRADATAAWIELTARALDSMTDTAAADIARAEALAERALATAPRSSPAR